MVIRTTASLVTMAASAISDDDVGVASASKGISRRAAWLARMLAWPSFSSSAWASIAASRSGLVAPATAAASPDGWSSVNTVRPPSRVARSTGSPRSFL